MSSDYMIQKNPHQGNAKKALFVCSAGILRSATAAHWAVIHKGWNTRNVGVRDYALIPLTQELIDWADVVYCMDHEHLQAAHEEFDPIPEHKFKVMGIPDDFAYMDEELVRRISEFLNNE